MLAELLPQYQTLLDVLARTRPLLEPADRAAFKQQLAGLELAGLELPALALPVGAPPGRRDALAAARRTQRGFAAGTMRLEPVATLLGYLADLPGPGDARRLYPAAGGVFAIDVLLQVAAERIDGLHAGVYRHDPAAHRLVMLSDLGPRPDNVGGANRPVLRDAAFTLLLVADLDRLAPLYGRHALQFATLEAGYLSQLLMQEAAGCGLGLCPVGALAFTEIRDSAGLLDGSVLVHSLFGGAPGRSSGAVWRAG